MWNKHLISECDYKNVMQLKLKQLFTTILCKAPKSSNMGSCVSKLRPVEYTCHELWHTWDPSCSRSSLEIFVQAYYNAMKIYSSVYLVRVIPSILRRFPDSSTFSGRFLFNRRQQFSEEESQISMTLRPWFWTFWDRHSFCQPMEQYILPWYALSGISLITQNYCTIISTNPEFLNSSVNWLDDITIGHWLLGVPLCQPWSQFTWKNMKGGNL